MSGFELKCGFAEICSKAWLLIQVNSSHSRTFTFWRENSTVWPLPLTKLVPLRVLIKPFLCSRHCSKPRFLFISFNFHTSLFCIGKNGGTKVKQLARGLLQEYRRAEVPMSFWSIFFKYVVSQLTASATARIPVWRWAGWGVGEPPAHRAKPPVPWLGSDLMTVVGYGSGYIQIVLLCWL